VTSHLGPPKDLVKHAVKRKLTPDPQFSSDESDTGAEDSDLSLDPARKRARSSASSVEPSRVLVDIPTGAAKDIGAFALAHGANLVSGENAHKYRPAFVEEEATKIELQYPSRSQREAFFLADSVESDGYKSLDDIRETVKHVCQNYLGEEEAQRYGDDMTGFDRRLARALHHGKKEDYLATIEEYNELVKQRQEDETVARVLSRKHRLSRPWVQRILDQVCSRTVSPHVELLREYKNGTDNVYGELLYDFVSDIFEATGLRSDQTFVDLGSGVGNVVLQAALEIGCESWGCEMMKNPCDLADLQAEEFPQRARLWGLRVGDVHLLRGDFLENREIGEVLKRADVVLVNNQAFGPELNSKLVDRFLDLKDGCRIVSLKSFKPEGYEISERNMNDTRHLLRVSKKEYYSKRVSWTDAPGNYFIAVKDPSEMLRYQSGVGRGRKRR